MLLVGICKCCCLSFQIYDDIIVSNFFEISSGDKYRQTLEQVQVLWKHSHLNCVNSAYKLDQILFGLYYQFSKVLLKEICKILCYCNSKVSEAVHSYFKR